MLPRKMRKSACHFGQYIDTSGCMIGKKKKGRKKARKRATGRGEREGEKRERKPHVTFKKHCEKTLEKKTSILYEQ